MSDKAFLRKLSLLPSVQAAVVGERDVIARRARQIFAAHDRPGGHRITTSTRRPDAFVWLTGPAPRSLEFGHFTPTPADPGDDWVPGWVPGLHILSRAARR